MQTQVANSCIPNGEGDMIEVYKIMNKICDSKVSKPLLNSYGDAVESIRSTRGHSKKLFKQRALLNVRKIFFSNRIVNL